MHTNRMLILILIFLFLLGNKGISEAAGGFLNAVELDYIANNPVLKAVSVKGAAPISFEGPDGDEKGIGKQVMNLIGERTGLNFEFELYDTVEESLSSDGDLVYGISPDYAPEGMILSSPFLVSETIIFMNSGVRDKDLAELKFAAINGGTLPEDINEENAVYFDTREESMFAVEGGIVDYGYGNAYSLAYYSIMYGFNDIVTIPQGKEGREYSIGLINGDETLLGIIESALENIEEVEMQTLVLDVSSNIERRITPRMIFEEYGGRIILVVSTIIVVLTYLVISNIKAKKRLSKENRRHKVLSNISNEYLFEYSIKNNSLELTEKCHEIFGEGEELSVAKSKIVEELETLKNIENGPTIIFDLPDEEKGVFKLIGTRVLDDMGKAESVIGKLVDISVEEAEKDNLIQMTQFDGLTGLYNAATAKVMIEENIKNKTHGRIDILVLIDLDNFKDVNDNYGHLMGDKTLKNLGKILRRTFRNNDIIGRIGGDEFCVYLKDVSSIESIEQKCDQVNDSLMDGCYEIKTSVSFGLSIVEDGDDYEKVFIKADKEMYHNKGLKQR